MKVKKKMAMKNLKPKIILITQRLTYLEEIDEERESLDPLWHGLFEEFGNVILVPLSYRQDTSLIFDSYDVAGIILSGGNDVSIHSQDVYGDVDADSLAAQLSLKRDRFERNLLEEAVQRNVKIFGVCRGLQLICVHYGAKIRKVSNHVARDHRVIQHEKLKRNRLSKTAKTLLSLFSSPDQLSVNVNSFHNFGIQINSVLPEDFEILLKPMDEDIIEAFAYDSHGMAGVMWHPERSRGLARTRDKRLLNNFFQISLDPPPSNKISNTDPHVFFLCAGQGTRLRPHTDHVPKCMVNYKGRCIIDYSLSVCDSLKLKNITLVTGYKSEVLVRPNVSYVHNPSYMHSNMVHSLMCGLNSEFYHNTDVIVSYSDIIYTSDVMKKLINSNSDNFSVIVDKDWFSLWSERMEDPLLDAETLKLDAHGYLKEIGCTPNSYQDIEGQYIGLIKLTSPGVQILKHFYKNLDKGKQYGGKSFDNMDMTTLLRLLIDAGQRIKPVFINGGWIEIDCEDDAKVDLDVSTIPLSYHGQMLNFGTKSETLYGILNCPKDYSFHVLPLYFFSFRQWQGLKKSEILKKCSTKFQEYSENLIVRSSSRREDSHASSSAGKFLTLANVECSKEALGAAIDDVFASYCDCQDDYHEYVDGTDQVLVQPMLHSVDVCGVICTTDLREYLPYFVVSYEEGKGTDGITSGNSNNIKTLILAKADWTSYEGRLKIWQKNILKVSMELQTLFNNDKIDIEFAIKDEKVYLFQVRPIVISGDLIKSSPGHFLDSLSKTYTKLKQIFDENLNCILDNMMDWNPAEMIGVKPSPLSRSLYELLITDHIAMSSRAGLGYRDVTKFPLMLNIAEKCYINSNVCFSSFIPADLNEDIARKLLEYYSFMLRKYPDRRDKIEFEVCFTCYETDLRYRLSTLKNHNFSPEEQSDIYDALLSLTKNMFGRVDCDLNSIKLLDEKISQFEFCKKMDNVNMFERTKGIIEIIKEYGTLPFANLARYAFVAVAILKSLVRTKHLSEFELEQFMQGLCTVSQDLIKDLNSLRCEVITKDQFLNLYGHLRPGAYDICSKRYDEAFDTYFPEDMEDPKSTKARPKAKSLLDLEESRKREISDYLKCTGLNVTFAELLIFSKKSLEGRERAKFIFTRAVSDLLKRLSNFGESIDIYKYDFSFIDLKQVFSSTGMLHKREYQNMIAANKIKSLHEGSMKLPDTIFLADDAYFYEEQSCRPNFVTKKSVTGDIVNEDKLFATSLQSKIVVISCADPGWDWLFSNDIGGLITCYGGANSHMAIRAAELSLPAAIGVGGSLFHKYENARVLQLNCATETIDVI